jgi:hypothetical protein
MKKTLLSFGLALLLAAAANAVPSDVTYTEGDVTTRMGSGKQQDTSIGDVLNTGDSLKTGKDGQAELNQKGVTIKVSHGTVFTLMEKSQAGKTASVMSVALGSIKFRYDKLTGSEPQVRTNGAVAGVRGTEFSVFAGADGSTLFAVDSGQVTVESEGKSVELAASEGVEVPLGQPPGDKIPLRSDQIDYKTWNGQKFDSMLADPLGSMKTVQTVMEEYIKNESDFYQQYLASKEKLDQEVQKRVEIFQQKGTAEAQKYQMEVVTPLSVQTGYLVLNVRYYSLAALSLRRFVAGRLYIYLKSRYIANQDAPDWKQFLVNFNQVLAEFEQSIAPQLVDADI